MKNILVCTALYHSRPEWLEKSITSIMNQTHKDFECWLIKDGCEEAARFQPSWSEKACLECKICEMNEKFCKNIVKEDKRFKYFVLPLNCAKGGWGPRNFCVMNSEHDLISYIDDDNWVEPNHLEALYNSIITNNSEWAFTGTKMYDGDCNYMSTRLNLTGPACYQLDTSEIMHHRHLVKKYGGWRSEYACINDWDLVQRWMADNVTWSHTGEVTLNFRYRAPGATPRTTFSL